MLFIDKDTDAVKNALIEHWKYYKCRIMKRLGNENCTPTCPVCTKTKSRSPDKRSAQFVDIVNYFNEGDNLEKMITGNAETLLENNEDFMGLLGIIEADFNDYLNASSEDKLADFRELHKVVLDIHSIFNYSDFSGAAPNEYGAYTLAKNLKRRTCTYCNRVYTTTLSTKGGVKVMRPQFDHWYPQTKFPALSVSFYNLIPSCYVCNSSIKSDVVLDKTLHIHPYIDINQTDEFRFNYVYSNSLNQYRVFIVPSEAGNKRAFDTIKKLFIDEMYNSHHEELSDLIKIKQAYSEEYINKMKKFFPKNGLNDNEIYRLLFGVEMNKSDFHSRPLSKFKSDILKRLGIIP